MANTLLPIEERNLTPDQVELLDKRRRRGQLFLVLCLQTLIVGTLVTLWTGQDWTLSPGWTKPMVYWDAIMFTLSLVFGVLGVRLKRGSKEFISYEGLRQPTGGGWRVGVTSLECNPAVLPVALMVRSSKVDDGPSAMWSKTRIV